MPPVRCLALPALASALALLFAPPAPFASQDPRDVAARAIFIELMAAEVAGRLALSVADQRFPEEYLEAPQQGWLQPA